MNITYPLIVASEIFEGYRLVADHKHHSEAKPLDDDIAAIAMQELGMNTKGVLIIDEMSSAELSNSWSLKFLTTPVIALQKNLSVAPSTRKYLILMELHKANGNCAWAQLAIRITRMALYVIIVNSSAGVGVMILQAAVVFHTANLLTRIVGDYFAKQAHDYAFNRCNDGEKQQVKDIYWALDSYRLERKLKELDKFEGLEGGRTNKTCNLIFEGTYTKFSALDLPFKLKPSGSKDPFYGRREDAHLKDFQSTKDLLGRIEVISTLVLVWQLSKVLPSNTNIGALVKLIAGVLRPPVRYVGHYLIDREFLKMNAAPDQIDPSVWKGAI